MHSLHSLGFLYMANVLTRKMIIIMWSKPVLIWQQVYGKIALLLFES